MSIRARDTLRSEKWQGKIEMLINKTSVARVLIVVSFTSLSKCSTPAKGKKGKATHKRMMELINKNTYFTLFIIKQGTEF